MEGLISIRESMVECANVAFFLADNSGESTKFHEDYNHPESVVRVRWYLGIYKEFEDMKNNRV
jgi:hypothetical protein